MRVLTGFLAGLLIASCGSGGSADPCKGCAGCCAAGVCQPGTAAAACGTGGGGCASCANGQSCQTGQCLAPGAGDKCAVAADCGAGALCAADVPGGGYCTRDCVSAPCPVGSACVDLGRGAKLCLKSCTSSAGCRSEQLCFSSSNGGLCLPKCTQDSECSSANCTVSTGVCGSSRVGLACAVDADCGQNPAFCDTSTAGGYCSLPCGGNTNAACPSQSNCASVGGGSSVCLVACGPSTPCRSGQLCVDTGGGATSCIPRCSSNLDCGASLRCDVPSGACVAGGPVAGQLGGACASAPDCTATLGSAAICATPARGYPGGYCSLNCSAHPGTDCGSTGTCVDFGGGVLDCLSKCATRADCRAGYACFPLGGSAGSVCTPACASSADCASGQACDATSGLCVVPSAGSGSTVEAVDLTAAGPVVVYTNMLSAPLSVTVPADAVSVTFVGQSADLTARVVVYRLESPDGRLYDYASTSSPMKVLPASNPGAFALLAPNSPSVPFTPGSWTIQLLGSKQTTATVKALLKRTAVRPLSAGSIDLNLFFVGAPNLSAATAPTDANFGAIFDQVKATWAQVGIAVGRVTYLDITGADLTRFQDLNEPDLGALMQKSLMTGANDNALNVFFVRTISGGGLAGYIILGESAGIPGVPIRGTSGSGMAVTTADFPRGLADIADTWVHEGSHWLGLFHTTESSGTAFDPLPDTPECPASPNDTDGDHIMQPQECTALGAENEMFWTSVSSIPHSKLTANQQFVLLRNPAVH